MIDGTGKHGLVGRFPGSIFVALFFVCFFSSTGDVGGWHRKRFEPVKKFNATLMFVKTPKGSAPHSRANFNQLVVA